MQRLTVRVLGFCLVVLGAAIPVSAQTVPRTEISGGYQFVNYSVDGEGESLPKGWYLRRGWKRDADLRSRLSGGR